MESFLKISAALAASANGTVSGNNKFYARQTKASIDPTKNLIWVCAENSIYEFPDLFDGQTIEFIELDPTDFPQPTF